MEEKIYKALMEMNPLKALGPDVFQALFRGLGR